MDATTRAAVAAALVALRVTQSQLKAKTGLGHSTCRRVLGIDPGGVSVDHIDQALAAYGLSLKVIRQPKRKPA